MNPTGSSKFWNRGALVLLLGIATNIGVTAATRFAYVANQTSSTLSEYSINSVNGALTPLPACPTTGVPSPVGLAVDPTGRFLYIASPAAAAPLMLVYSINPTTGCVTLVQRIVTGAGPKSIGINSSGACLYLTSQIANTISAYTINPTTGVLTFVGSAGTPPGPLGVAVDPFGQFVYVTDNTASLVSGFSIVLPGCGLAAVPGSPFATGGGPTGVALDPVGQFVYVNNSSANTVTLYTINPATGHLTFSAVFGTGTAPAGVGVDHFSQFLYTANNGSATASAFAINPATGTLAALPTVATGGAAPEAAVVDQSGRFLYVTNSGSATLAGYQINQLTGHLAPSPGSPFAAGSNPVAVATTP
jgi:6-phosphogluconolactonase (cycloisomerase 2 family)